MPPRWLGHTIRTASGATLPQRGRFGNYDFMAFDCLYHRGQDLRPRPLATRRNVLEDVLDGQDLVLPVRRLADNGLKAWQQVLEHGWEGLVAKDPASPYVGGRTLKWLKVKQPKYREKERGFYKP